MKKRRTSSPQPSSSKRQTHGLIGKLTALSHILHTKPNCIILELCTNKKPQYIIVDQPNLFLKTEIVIIEKFYQFSNLLCCTIALKGGTCEVFKFSEDTTLEEVDAFGPLCLPPSLQGVFKIQGTVREVDEELGLCYLDGSTILIMSSCARIALVPFPKPGQEITAFNVHRVYGNNNEVLFAMCVRSFLLIGDDRRSFRSANNPRLNLSPLLISLGVELRSYKTILWLQKCNLFLKQSFTNDFLISSGISVSECDIFRSTLLQNIAQCLVKRFSVQKESLLQEFITIFHNASCGTLHEETSPPSLLTLSELFKERSCLDNCEQFWIHDIKRSEHRKPLIGVITFKNSSLRLSLSDSSESVSCTVLTRGDQILTGENISSVNKKVVIAWEYDMVMEKFCFERRNLTHTQIYRLFGLYFEALDVLSSIGRDWENSRSRQLAVNKKCFYSPSPSKSRVKQQKEIIQSTDVSTGSCKVGPGGSRIFPVPSGFCISPVRNQYLKDFMSQLVYVQTKSSISVTESRKMRFCVLVTLLGEMVQGNTSSSSRSVSDNVNKNMFLSLEGGLVAAHPFIAVNSVYEIRFPEKWNKDFLRKGTVLSSIEGLRPILPTADCVTLPDCCEIHLVPNHSLPNVNLEFRDCYGINQAVQDASPNELINILGYVIDRFHQDPKFDREKREVGVNGFGVPGPKIVVLGLRDTPMESQTSLPYAIYMSYWTFLQYPLGLVPGAKVIFRFVRKVIPVQGSSAKSTYFRSSVLTSVEILELPLKSSENVTINQNVKEVWGPRSLLCFAAGTLDCKWMSVSMTHVHRVSMSATCSACGHQISNRVCTFVGCAAPINPLVFSQASFIISDLQGNKTLVFVPSALVQKALKISDKIWRMMIVLAQSCGQLKFSQFDSLKDISKQPIEQRVFHAFCMSRLSGERFHLLCRPFNRREKGGNYSAFNSLYAVDIAPVTLGTAMY